MKRVLFFTLTFCLLIASFTLNAQIEFPSLSPKGYVSQIVGNTTIEVEYERPSARNRKVFGELVPWNQLWRTGAAYCTKISFDKTVKVGNQEVAAGKYALFTIPNKEEWLIILNTDTTLYGTSGYNYKKDVARFVVKANPSPRYYEALTIDIDIIPNNARMYLSWENIQVHFDILTTTDEKVLGLIYGELMTGKIKDADQLGAAADYLLFQSANLYDAMKLADMAMEIDPDLLWLRRLKMEIYEKLYLYKEALVEVDKAIGLTKKRDYEKELYRERDIQTWKDHGRRINGKLKSITERD